MASLAVGCGGDDTDDSAEGTTTTTNVADGTPSDDTTQNTGVDDETGTGDMEGVTEEDDPCVTEMATSGTDGPSGKMDVETAFIESGDDGTVTGVMASYALEDATQDGPSVPGDDVQVPDDELLYVFELELDDPSAGLEGGSLFVEEGVDAETVQDATSDQAEERGTLVDHRLRHGSEEIELADTVIEILEVQDDRVCGFVGASVTDITEVTTVTGRFAIDRAEAMEAGAEG